MEFKRSPRPGCVSGTDVGKGGGGGSGGCEVGGEGAGLLLPEPRALRTCWKKTKRCQSIAIYPWR